MFNAWVNFLDELDTLLAEPVILHCIGGFVATQVFDIPRVTADIDFASCYPNIHIEKLAGAESELRKKHKLWLQRVPFATLPEGYETRMSEIFAGRFNNLRLFAPDPYDFILSKLERNSPKDREDANFIFRRQRLNAGILRERYSVLRMDLSNEARHDLTLELWLEYFEEE